MAGPDAPDHHNHHSISAASRGAMLDHAGIVDQHLALCNAAGEAFYNTSRFTLRDLRAKANPQQLKADFEAYLDGFSPNVQVERTC